MPFVLDASLALSWHFEDEVSELSEKVLLRLDEDTAEVPALWPLEIANGLLLAERRGRLTRAKCQRARELTLELPLVIHDVPPELALGALMELGREHGLTSYDAAYLHLAMSEGLPLATQDKALIAAAMRVGVAVVN